MNKKATAQLVERARDGDKTAFERLYDLHCRKVFALCIRMTSSPVEAEDLTQEAFLQAFRKLATFRGEAAFSTWIYRITCNVVLMRRRRKVHPTVSFDDAIGPNANPTRTVKFISHPDPTPKLVDRLSLSRALDQLPAGYKKVFLMHDVEGYEHSEIAELTGRSIGNSKSQLHRARLRLRELLTCESDVEKRKPA